MSTSTFRALVAEVAARAKEKLPEAVDGRIAGAAKLVLAHDIEHQDDGSILVGSSTDALKVYRLSGQTCECKDFTDGKAPEGWCRHRIAAGIAKRVGEMLAAQAEAVEPEPTPPVAADPLPVPALVRSKRPPALPEAPASVNVRLTLRGREVQWTLRDTDEGRLEVRLDALLARHPVPQAPAPAAQTGEGWCAKHGLQMTQTTKEGRSWWSHRTAEGWCSGKGR